MGATRLQGLLQAVLDCGAPGSELKRREPPRVVLPVDFRILTKLGSSSSLSLFRDPWFVALAISRFPRLTHESAHRSVLSGRCCFF
jgi:hypothetical protein